jgi:alkylated DNA repair dioxygenase AlkB
LRTKPEKLITPALNLYHSGDEGMGWHSDGERIKKNGAIASVSLERKKICLKHKTTKK